MRRSNGRVVGQSAADWFRPSGSHPRARTSSNRSREDGMPSSNLGETALSLSRSLSWQIHRAQKAPTTGSAVAARQPSAEYLSIGQAQQRRAGDLRQGAPTVWVRM